MTRRGLNFQKSVPLGKLYWQCRYIEGRWFCVCRTKQDRKTRALWKICWDFFFFSRQYNPWWVLAYFTISFHNLLSLHFSLQFLTFIYFKSSSTWSSHLNLGLPTGLDEHGSHSVSCLTVLVVSILITCAAQRNLCDFINLTIFFLN